MGALKDYEIQAINVLHRAMSGYYNSSRAGLYLRAIVRDTYKAGHQGGVALRSKGKIIDIDFNQKNKLRAKRNRSRDKRIRENVVAAKKSIASV